MYRQTTAQMYVRDVYTSLAILTA